MKSHRIAVFIATRLQVDAATGRHRVPDLMVVDVPFVKGKVVTDVPATVVEITSPDDTFDDIMDRCFEYDKLTVGDIIVVEPDNERSWIFEDGSLNVVTTNIRLKLGDSAMIDLPSSQLFAETDDAKK